MILNELFRRICGGSFYYNPPAVMGELVNQGVGTVIITPPISFQAESMAQRMGEKTQVGTAVFLYFELPDEEATYP